MLLRLGLAFVFIYAGVASLMHPFEWISFLPSFIGTFINLEVALKGIAVFEIILGVCLVSGKYRKVVSALAVLMLAGILLADHNQFIITFRDVGLLFAALALFFSPEYPPQSPERK